MQLPAPWLTGAADSRYAEDCLYLNVWRPARPAKQRPVLVWIYGGAFVGGGTSFPVYDGSAFARNGIVFVSFNYRLGRLGFFAHPALTAAHEGALGNYGYQDQLAALQWVRRNIRAFGGDPARVTVMGESAGGISVLDLATSPQASGLFRQAIVMSGGGRAAMSNWPIETAAPGGTSAETIGAAFAQSVGILGDKADALARLRALPAAVIMQGLGGANLKINGEPKDGLTYVGGPIIDGRTKLAVIDEAMARGMGPHVPILIGTTSADLGVPTGQGKDDLFAAFGDRAAAARAAFDPDGSRDVTDMRSEITRDRLLTEPARFVAQQARRNGQPAWLYRFGYVPQSRKTTWSGVPHGGDTPFFFDTIRNDPSAASDANDEAVAKLSSAYIANFVRFGNPNGKGFRGELLPQWQSFAKTPGEVLSIGSADGTKMMVDPLKYQLDLVQASAGAALVQK